MIDGPPLGQTIPRQRRRRRPFPADQRRRCQRHGPFGRRYARVLPDLHAKTQSLRLGLHAWPLQQAVHHARAHQRRQQRPRVIMITAAATKAAVCQRVRRQQHGRWSADLLGNRRDWRGAQSQNGDRPNRRNIPQAKIHRHSETKKAPTLSRRGFSEIDPVIEVYLRVPTTSTSTRRFFARPARVALSATAWVSPLPSVYTRLLSMPLLTR